MRHFFRVGFVTFRAWKYKKNMRLKSSISGYQENFNFGARKFHFLNYRKFFWDGFFFYFFEIGLKSAQNSPTY